MSINWGMDEEDMVQIHDGTYKAIKKNKINAICNNVDGHIDYHTKWGKSDREINIIWSYLYVESKKWYIWTYLQHRNRLTDKENKLTKGKREEQIRRLVLTHTHTIIYKIDNQGVPVVAQWFKHPAYSLWDASSIPDFTQWVKDPALPPAVA